VVNKELPVTGPKRKTFATDKRVDLHWKPDNAMKARALKACSDYMQSEKQSGKGVAQILGENHSLTVDSGLYGVFHLSCAGLITLGTKHVFERHPMKVVCQGSTLPGKPGLVKTMPFAISHVSLKPESPSYTGSCPKDFKFLAHMKTNRAPGKIRYRFRNHLGVQTPWRTMSAMPNHGFLAFDHIVKLQNIKLNELNKFVNQLQHQNGKGMVAGSKITAKENPWLSLEVQNLANNKKYSSKASYSYQCTQPTKAGFGYAVNKGQDKGKADLVVLPKSFRLGSKSVNSSNALVIGADEANGKVAGMCQFRMQYKIRNKGNMDAEPAFTTKTSRGSIALHFANTPELQSGHARTLTGSLKLRPGDNMLLIQTDHADKVEESNEANNAVRINVTVKGDCGSGNEDRPGRPQYLPQRPAEAGAGPERGPR
jgi:hypothetical protein